MSGYESLEMRILCERRRVVGEREVYRELARFELLFYEKHPRDFLLHARNGALLTLVKRYECLKASELGRYFSLNYKVRV